MMDELLQTPQWEVLSFLSLRILVARPIGCIIALWRTPAITRGPIPISLVLLESTALP